MKINLHNLATSVRTLLGNVQTHLTDNTKHVSTNERNSWNNKTDDSKIASVTELGHVKVGENLTIDSEGKLSAETEHLATKEELATEVDQLFTSVSNGKTVVANAITQKGITTATDAEFATMAANINAISTSTGTAKAADVLVGKTFSNTGNIELTGTMPNYADITILGSWKNNGGAGIDVNLPSRYGYFSSATYFRANDSNFVAANILQGKTVFGLAGTAQVGRKFKSGTGYTQGYNASINTSTLGFTPTALRIDYNDGSKVFYTYHITYAPYITNGGQAGSYFVSLSGGVININCPYSDGTPFTYYAWE